MLNHDITQCFSLSNCPSQVPRIIFDYPPTYLGTYLPTSLSSFSPHLSLFFFPLSWSV